MSNETPEAGKLSPVEAIKETSQWLRGGLVAELAADTDHFTPETMQLLKFHGSYQQEDRDARKTRAKAGTGKHYMFMIRLKLPAGRLMPAQYLAVDELAGKYANSTIRLTTRQSIQFHGILKGNLKATIAELNQALVSTLGGCGDVNRNVMACPAPTNDPRRVELVQLAHDIAAHLAPKSLAYHDVWINGESVYSSDAQEPEGVEPIYGKVYLPRKFKVGLTLPEDNCVDILTQDLGFVAICENGKTIGYNVMVGGGMGRTNGKPNTFPHLAQALCYVEPNEVVSVSESVVKFYRDHGNRADRKRARLKYVVHDLGLEKVREIMASTYLEAPLRLPKHVEITDVDLHLGWQPQGNGQWFLGLSVENGRIKDEGEFQLRTALRMIVEKFGCEMRVTGQQDVLLCNIDTANRPAIDDLLREHGIARPDALSLIQKWSMACPATPTCPLAITESERVMPSLVDALEAEILAQGLQHERISMRMTGCPNGCARPYQSEIGLVGRGGTKYTMFLGGSTLGTRLNYLFQDGVPFDQVVPVMSKLLSAFRSERRNGESFGDYCAREGQAKMCEKAGFSVPTTAV